MIIGEQLKDLKKLSIEYHQQEPYGKMQIVATKPLVTQHDLALAYSPGVAAVCEAIVEDPSVAMTTTSRGNLVAVISNGTAVLGLGAIGPLASKPVMEGKAVLFKKFAGIDVFDIEVAENDPKKLVDIVASLEPTFGGINLEDIKAPECFYVERQLKEKLNIPVFHDDQHGTAIIASAAIVNSLKLVNKKIEDVKLVASGAGAAAISCLELLVKLGMKRENIIVCDSRGVIYTGRKDGMDEFKEKYMSDTDARVLAEAIEGADIFLGLSMAGALTSEMVAKMCEDPIILALANPVPEIMPEEARKVRPKAIIATGRSDFPNQVNNVLCFPFIFRGAIDVGATAINEEMKLACVNAIADLAMEAATEEVFHAYGGQTLTFGPEYIIPKPFDPRLIIKLAPAVAQAAMDSGVATKPIEDFEAYKDKLSSFVFPSSFLMKPVFSKARQEPKRLVYAEGEDKRVLQAVQHMVDEGIAKPILIGRAEVISHRIEQMGLSLDIDKDIELVNILNDKRYKEYWTEYHQLLSRKGVSPDFAKMVMRTDNTAVACMMVRRGDADAMIAGTVGRYHHHVTNIEEIIGTDEESTSLSALYPLVLPQHTIFITDSHINENPTAEDIATMTVNAANKVKSFGIDPKVALVSHSNFGSHDNESANKMKEALALLNEMNVDFQVDGEMHASSALNEKVRKNYIMDGSALTGKANILVMPNIDAAHIATGILRTLGNAVSIGPVLVGAAKPAHIVTNSATVRGLINMSAIAVTDAQYQE